MCWQQTNIRWFVLLTCPTAEFRGELGPEFERDDVSCDDVSCESSLAKDVNSCSCGGD